MIKQKTVWMLTVVMCLVGGATAYGLWSLGRYNADTVVALSHQVVMPGLTDSISILVVADIHLNDPEVDADRMRSLFKAVESLPTPDAVFFSGDYNGRGSLRNPEYAAHAQQVLQRLASLAPAYGVLGNHDQYHAKEWNALLRKVGIAQIEHQTQSIQIGSQRVCLRGLGDAFTDHYRPIPFPDDCVGVKVTLTHDPLAIQQDSEPGLYFAGHTHCGQLRLPFIPTFWVPTAASDNYWCGAGRDEDKHWWVSSGLGTSVVPLRLGTRAVLDWFAVSPD